MNSIGQILSRISPSAPRVFARQLDMSEFPPEDTGLPPFYPVFYSRGSKGPNGGPPVHIQGLLIANFSLYITIFVQFRMYLTCDCCCWTVCCCWDPSTVPDWPASVPGTPHCSRLACSTSGPLWGLQGVHLLRLRPCVCLLAPSPCSGTFPGSPGATGRTLPLYWGAGRGPLCPAGRSTSAGLQLQDPTTKEASYTDNSE